MLVKHQGTPGAAIRQSGEFHGLLLWHAAAQQHRLHLLRREHAEGHGHAAREDCVEQGTARTRDQDESHGAFRLLERLQQTILRRFIHAVRLIDEDDALLGEHGIA